MSIVHTISSVWKNYKQLIIALLLSVYSLPGLFFVTPNIWLDGSWIRALNMAINSHRVFGSDFVFTFGPLGFLCTRNIQYINRLWLLAGDIFLFAGFFYFAYKYLSSQKVWVFIVLPAMFLFRAADYSQTLFLLFIIYTVLNFNNRAQNKFELLYCGLAGGLLFFIKVNYGIVSLAGLLFVSVFLIRSDFRSFILFLTATILFFCIIYFSVHIDLVSYVKYSLLLIKNYGEAMCYQLHAAQSFFLFTVIFIAVFLAITAYTIVQAIKQREGLFNKLTQALLLCITCFLFYKNGYTRADYYHYELFYSIFPMFIVSAIFLYNYQHLVISKIIAGIVTILSILAVFFYKER